MRGTVAEALDELQIAEHQRTRLVIEAAAIAIQAAVERDPTLDLTRIVTLSHVGDVSLQDVLAAATPEGHDPVVDPQGYRGKGTDSEG